MRPYNIVCLLQPGCMILPAILSHQIPIFFPSHQNAEVRAIRSDCGECDARLLVRCLSREERNQAAWRSKSIPLGRGCRHVQLR